MHRRIRLVALIVLLVIGMLPRESFADMWLYCDSQCIPGGTMTKSCQFAFPHGGGTGCYDPGTSQPYDEYFEGVCIEWAAQDGSPYDRWYTFGYCDDSIYNMPEGAFYCSWPNAWSCQ